MKSILQNFYLLAALMLPVVMITSCGDDDDGGGPVPPDPSSVVASFSSQVDADNSLTYNFTNSSVVNGITDRSFSSSWDFGGDGTSTDENPTYTFSDEGTFTVTLTVTAADGVSESASETIEVTAPKNRYAVVTDTQDDDTGELRLALEDSIMTGRITFMYRVAAGPVDMDIQDAFINVAGNSTTGDFALVEVRLKDNAMHAFREGASDDAIAAANFPEGMADVWAPVEISWAADGTNAPTYSVSINGQSVITDAISTTNGGAGDVDGHLLAVKDGVHNLQWKYAGNSAVNDGVYHVDDIVIYSSDSGTETIVFEDDFQGRTAGDNLDSEENEDSPYHPNSTDVSVGEDQ
ncbi:PKD domain-containing protein [Lewinella sp. 4G2]|uniref:PKD domain-containing protein n=1 Tax=Lewinella sp. 4G2 TaxID=1803372 RepID=UPI0007B4745D|nr:PKD domain-containing protein [Lewinella sp. 4G2]OAV43878.1 PKD domain-containing protein [Lewinella sp. 4G2]